MPDAPATDVEPVDSAAGPVDAGDPGDGNSLAETIREEVTKAVNGILGRGASDDEVHDDGDNVAEGVTAPGKTAAERARRGPTREQSVAEETRAELERIRKQEKADEENASLRAEIERLGGEVKALAEKPPEQVNRLQKVLWG